MKTKDLLMFSNVLGLLTVSMNHVKAKRVLWQDMHIELNEMGNEVKLMKNGKQIEWSSSCSDILKNDWVLVNE